MNKARGILTGAFLSMVSASTSAQNAYLIEAESFQFKGKWVVEKSSDCLGTAMLRVYQDNDQSPESDALTVVNIGEAGTYRVWTRSQDYLDSARPRTYILSVDGKKMNVSGAHGVQGFRWEMVGEVNLSAKQTLLRLHDAGNYYGRCDAILLTKDASVDPNNLSNTEIARWRKAPVAMNYVTSFTPTLDAPREITAGYSVLASASNPDFRISFVKLSDGSIACKTDFFAAGSWRRFLSSDEDNRVALISSSTNPTVNFNGFYPSWNSCAARREFSFEGQSYPITLDGDNSNPFFVGELTEMHPTAVTKTDANTIKVTYDCGGKGELIGYWNLPEQGCHAFVRLVFKPDVDGAYSLALHALKGVSPEAVDGVLMPPMFFGKRLPSTPQTLFSSMMPQCLSVVETKMPFGNVSAFISANLDNFSQDWGGYDHSPIGFTLRNSAGEYEPVAFAPLPGMADAKVNAGRRIEANFVIGVKTGSWGDALEYVSDNVFEVVDYRRPGSASITTAFQNVVALIKDPTASGWNEAMKGFWDIEANGNVSPTVVQAAPLALLGASMIMNDEELYVTLALPSIEFALSRNNFRFVGNNPQKLNPMGSQFPTTVYEGINTLTGGLNPWIAAQALPSGQLRVANGYFSTMQPFRQALSAYRMTNDEAWLSNACTLAGKYIDELYAGNSQVAAPATFYNSQMVPDWTALLDLYNATGDQRYVDAASFAASATMAGVKTWPKTADGTQTVHPGGKYDGVTTIWWRGDEPYRLGFPRSGGDSPEREVESWRVSGVGLGMEQPATYFVRSTGKTVRPIYMNNWAPRMLELSSASAKPIYETYSRNAVIGRSDNYPGYYATGYTDINLSERFPYNGPDVSSIYYHHIPAYMAMLQDYLVELFKTRSRGEVVFPAARQEGFVWFANNIYGASKGVVYGKEAKLWMPADGLKVDNPAVNMLAARDENHLYILLTGEGDASVTARVTVSDEVANMLVEPTRQFSVDVPARDVKLVILDANWIDFSDLPELSNGFEVMETGTVVGKIYLYRIRSPFGWDSVYGFAECGAISGLTINVECGEDSYSATKWPFEWSFRGFGYDQPVTIKIRLSINGTELKTVEHTFDPGKSGVAAVVYDEKDALGSGIFTIDGRKVEKITTPGFYIRNGRKIFQK